MLVRVELKAHVDHVRHPSIVGHNLSAGSFISAPGAFLQLLNDAPDVRDIDCGGLHNLAHNKEVVLCRRRAENLDEPPACLQVVLSRFGVTKERASAPEPLLMNKLT